MKYTGQTFRPPLEANTLLLQVTVGCALNNCSFCTMYKDTEFSIENMAQIESDLKEARSKYKSLKRIFLINGDAFVLSARRLKIISDKIVDYFPEMETITMYASIRNIMDKTDDELIMLKNTRINDLWIGLETGHETALKRLNKGYQLDDVYKQLERINTVGFNHRDIFMLGAAGHNQGLQNAAATAKLINFSKPELVGFTSLGVFLGSGLEQLVKEGQFNTASELEILEEEKRLIELIAIDGLAFFANHPTNATSITGVLPKDKEMMIQIINETIEEVDDDILSDSIRRFSL